MRFQPHNNLSLVEVLGGSISYSLRDEVCTGAVGVDLLCECVHIHVSWNWLDSKWTGLPVKGMTSFLSFLFTTDCILFWKDYCWGDVCLRCVSFIQKADGPMHFTASSAPISIATEESALKSDTDPKIFAEVWSVKCAVWGVGEGV